MLNCYVMKLFFDARYIRTDIHDGISRFSTELARALESKADVTYLICDPKQLEKLPERVRFIKIHEPTSVFEPFSSFVLNRHKPDIVFSPMQTIGSLGKKFKLILTVHDLIYYRHRKAPKRFSATLRFMWWLYHLSYYPERFLLNRSNMVVAVSEATKADVLKANLTNKPVEVVHNAPPSLKAGYKQTLTKPTNLIYMGAFIGYKNVETLIRGMEYLPDCTLHLLSPIDESQKRAFESIIPLGSRVIFHNGVSDEEYSKLLTDNAILVSASKDEGYGIPLAEALMVGTPVVVSDIPIFHEVAGPGAEYFNHDDPQDFSRAVMRMQKLDNYQKRGSRGQKHIQKFSWDKSAEALLSAIELHLLK